MVSIKIIGIINSNIQNKSKDKIQKYVCSSKIIKQSVTIPEIAQIIVRHIKILTEGYLLIIGNFIIKV